MWVLFDVEFNGFACTLLKDVGGFHPVDRFGNGDGELVCVVDIFNLL